MKINKLIDVSQNIERTQMHKLKLDEILEKHKAQPVGHGYIDIIVCRNNYKELIVDLVNNGFNIESISWWEWCEREKENEYGLGGPKSVYYNGWFSEIPTNVDDIIVSTGTTNENIITKIIKLVETKPFHFQTKRFHLIKAPG